MVAVPFLPQKSEIACEAVHMRQGKSLRGSLIFL
jgi:hypothetical protein